MGADLGYGLLVWLLALLDWLLGRLFTGGRW